MSRAGMQRYGRSLEVALGAVFVLACWVGSAVPEERRDHLPFFYENRAFILQAWERAQLDHDVEDAAARSWDYDPWADWNASEAVSHARAAYDTAAAPADLGAFHAGLDSLLQAMQQAGDRLEDLDARFAAEARTGLELTLANPRRLDIVRIEAALEGEPLWQHDLSQAERAALDEGGILEVLRQAVEPRLLQIEVRTWLRGRQEPLVTAVDVDPVPNRLIRVHLTLHKADEPATQQRTLVSEGS
jgi:hypothetical protein